jgi:beclin 1
VTRLSRLLLAQDLIDFATSNDPSLQLPYKITESRVHDLPVDMDRPVLWTRAMKYMLTNLKWLLVWASKWRRV